MTLVVCTYTRTESNAIHLLGASSSEELAGFERCRQDLWGAKAVLSLGLKLLPSLTHEDLYVEGEGLTQLEREANVILANLDFVAEQTDYPLDFIRFRTQNILHAIERAKQVQGGVVIY